MILFLNSVVPKCGVYQFGLRVYDILKDSTKYRSIYAEVGDLAQYRQWCDKVAPDIIIYNYHYARMPWLTRALLDSPPVHVALYHEAKKVQFDYYLYADPTLQSGCRWRDVHAGGFWCRMGRPIPEYTNKFKPSAVPTIGSFGLGTSKKNYDLLVARVNAEFNHAIININIPGRARGIATLAKQYQAQITKKGIHLNVTHSFMSESDLLDFLGKNTINVFHYQSSGRKHVGISSVTDYALAVRRPMAITETNLFRHIWPRAPEICLENHTLPQIIARGTAPLQQFYKEWTRENVLSDIEIDLAGIVRYR